MFLNHYGYRQTTQNRKFRERESKNNVFWL